MHLQGFDNLHMLLRCRDDGVGLAAPQVGINVRLMVFNPTGERGQGDELVLANPRIISASRKQELGEEGCLSFLKHNTRELILADVEVRGLLAVRRYCCWPFGAAVLQHVMQVCISLVWTCVGLLCAEARPHQS